jgi:hypothetical protein
MTDNDHSTPRTTDRDVLESMLIQIERAWFDRGDRGEVERLIAEHPELAEELHEFSQLLEPDEIGMVEPRLAKAEESLHDWLLNDGIVEALSAAAAARREPTATTVSDPAGDGREKSDNPNRTVNTESWMTILHHRTGCQRTEIASRLPNVTLEFLSLVSRHPDLIPYPVKATLAESVQKCFGVPAEESLDCLSDAPLLMKRAASRRAPVERAPVSFDEILDRAEFDDSVRAFWLGRGGGQT